jgi:hypothetical protein
MINSSPVIYRLETACSLHLSPNIYRLASIVCFAAEWIGVFELLRTKLEDLSVDTDWAGLWFMVWRICFERKAFVSMELVGFQFRTFEK